VSLCLCVGVLACMHACVQCSIVLKRALVVKVEDVKRAADSGNGNVACLNTLHKEPLFLSWVQVMMYSSFMSPKQRSAEVPIPLVRPAHQMLIVAFTAFKQVCFKQVQENIFPVDEA